jgi:hypothetical protein
MHQVDRRVVRRSRLRLLEGQLRLVAHGPEQDIRAFGVEPVVRCAGQQENVARREVEIFARAVQMAVAGDHVPDYAGRTQRHGERRADRHLHVARQHQRRGRREVAAKRCRLVAIEHAVAPRFRWREGLRRHGGQLDVEGIARIEEAGSRLRGAGRCLCVLHRQVGHVGWFGHGAGRAHRVIPSSGMA